MLESTGCLSLPVLLVSNGFSQGFLLQSNDMQVRLTGRFKLAMSMNMRTNGCLIALKKMDVYRRSDPLSVSCLSGSKDK